MNQQSEPPRPSAASHSVLAAYARLIVRTVELWGIAGEEALAGTGVTQAALEDPLARVPLGPLTRLMAQARELTGEPGLGWYAGVESRISMYGYVGFGILSAATVRDAIEILVTFHPLLATILSMRLEVSPRGEHAALVIEENTDMGAARDFVLGGVVAAIWQLSHRISGAPPTGSVDLVIAEPEYFPRIRAALSPPADATTPATQTASPWPTVRFGQPSNRIIFDRAKLDLPLVMADDAAFKLAREQCERGLAAFAMSLVERVRRTAVATDNLSSLADVAAELHLSPSSLKRKLAEQGLTFGTVAEEARCDKAIALLRSNLSVADVSEQLGYSTPANFIRAFRTWMHTSPGAYRRGSSRKR
ncbi:MAG TPA: AraC family transcriptional regulator [Polyangiaceae bacterium]|jgi:AraC-like DNA-binding protein|nr:AraC family transcriptional regulator [Polyangiaceae bacterium]